MRVAETGWLISVLPANTNASNKAESCLETERDSERGRARPKKETEVNPEMHYLKLSQRLDKIFSDW